jgi:RNA polymerase sigma factor (sigma-70 family)
MLGDPNHDLLQSVVASDNAIRKANRRDGHAQFVPMNDEQNLKIRFWEFFEQNYQKLFRIAGYCSTHDYPAEDLLQDAFLFAWPRLDPAKCNWLAWLRRIMIRKRIDRYRSLAGAPVVLAGDMTTDEDSDLITSAVSNTASPLELAEELGDAKLVKQALACMQNDQQRRVLECVLVNFTADGDPNLEKVADDMNISHSNAKQLYYRARKAIKHSLRELAQEMKIRTERPNHEP